MTVSQAIFLIVGMPVAALAGVYGGGGHGKAFLCLFGNMDTNAL